MLRILVLTWAKLVGEVGSGSNGYCSTLARISPILFLTSQGKKGTSAGPWKRFPRALNRGNTVLSPHLFSPVPHFLPLPPFFLPWQVNFFWHGYH